MERILAVIIKIRNNVVIDKEEQAREYLDKFEMRYRFYRNKIVENVFNGDKEKYYDSKTHYQILYKNHEGIKLAVKNNYIEYHARWIGRLKWNNWTIGRIG